MALMPSLPSAPIHCALKLDWDRNPVNEVPMEARNSTTPVIQVSARLPRQAAIQNLPHRWTTMNPKNSSTLHRCTELT